VDRLPAATERRADPSVTAGRAGAEGAAVPLFRAVYDQYASFVWRVLRRLGVRPADVEDVCQEVFVVVHRKLPGFGQRSSLRTWLYGITVRCASDHRRRAHLRHETLADTAAGQTVDAPQPGRVAAKQARALLDAIVDGLDDDKRAVFVLYELEELQMAEVAEAVGCPLQTAYSRLHAARAEVTAAVERLRAREGG
jgi:RNA polymerase sigma-70 factor (ECF subfamily)